MPEAATLTQYVDGSFLCSLVPVHTVSHDITGSSNLWVVHTKATFYALCYFGHSTSISGNKPFSPKVNTSAGALTVLRHAMNINHGYTFNTILVVSRSKRLYSFLRSATMKLKSRSTLMPPNVEV